MLQIEYDGKPTIRRLNVSMILILDSFISQENLTVYYILLNTPFSTPAYPRYCSTGQEALPVETGQGGSIRDCYVDSQPPW